MVDQKPARTVPAEANRSLKGVAVRRALAWVGMCSASGAKLPHFLVMVLMSAVIAASSAPRGPGQSGYAGIVIDAKTGRTLYASNAEDRRYPASLTKMMTLYLTFEALSTGRITKATRIPDQRARGRRSRRPSSA